MNNIKEVNRIIAKYTAGKATLEEVNADLNRIGSGIRLDPGKNILTADETANTHVGKVPNKTSGYGLLDTGTGTLDKVEVQHGKLVGNDVGEMYALCIIGGKVYHVKGDTLTE